MLTKNKLKKYPNYILLYNILQTLKMGTVRFDSLLKLPPEHLLPGIYNMLMVLDLRYSAFFFLFFLIYPEVSKPYILNSKNILF